MKHGNYTKLAKYYINRSGYSQTVIKALALYIGAYRAGFKIADIGAGTGKLTSILQSLGFSGYAIEPNDQMRKNGLRLFENKDFIWQKGTGEQTLLKTSSIDWVLMASAFHWTDNQAAIREFYRILKPGGFLTVMWNPRDIEKSEIEKVVEKIIKNNLPVLKRVSSGAATHTKNWEEVLITNKKFQNLIFMEACHEETMSPERYIGVWKSVNDIQVQAGEQGFKKILKEIKKILVNRNSVRVVYRTRAWTVQSTK